MKKILPLSLLLWSPAILAQTAPAAGGSGSSPLIGMVLMLAVFFLLIVWPQSRKAKKHAAFLAALQKEDNVVTSAGLYGKIVGVAERVITLEIAPNVKVRVERQAIAAKVDPAGQQEAA